jgi:hypothetical protein
MSQLNCHKTKRSINAREKNHHDLCALCEIYFCLFFIRFLCYVYIIDVCQIQVGKFNISLLEFQKTFGKKKKSYLTYFCSID